MSRSHPSNCASNIEVGSVVYWPFFDETFMPIIDRDGRNPDLQDGMESGTVLDWNDPSIWAHTAAFPTDTPDPDEVKAYVEEIRVRDGLTAYSVPVFWRDGMIRSAPLDELYLDPADAPAPKPPKTTAPKRKKKAKPAPEPVEEEPTPQSAGGPKSLLDFGLDGVVEKLT